MRLSLLTAVLMAGTPMGIAFAQAPSLQGSGAPAKQSHRVQPVKGVVTSMPSQSASLLAGGSDDCSTAAATNAISGPGTFLVDNTLATSGSPIGSCGAIGNDVWFYWTATSTGLAVISTCGGTTFDTVISVWNDGVPAGSCPTTEVLCLDDFCNFQTQVSLNVTAGQKYFLELGGYAGTQYSGTFTIAMAVPPANDSCTTPTVISGAGPHAFDNSFASTGAEGQAEALCTQFGSTVINNDVWFRWTSSFTGTARVSTCGGFVDTKIAAYSGAGCPTGAAIGCNDDTCGFQTVTDFPVVNGGVYTIQVGLYPFTTTGGADTFTITQFIPAVNDGCATPINVVGNGPHAFDNSTTSTGVEGQNEALCLFFGSTTIAYDSWYTWTATATGLMELSLCAGTGYDSKVAIYQGSGCPTGPALACNDDSCGLTSALCFNAVSGQVYTIQIGSYPFAAAGSGAFAFTLLPPPPGGCAPLDDSSSEQSIGVNGGGTIVWMTANGAIGQSASVSSVDTCFGTPLFPGGYIPQGPVTIAVWDDPNDDGNANDLVLLGTATAAVNPASVETDVFQTISFGSPIAVNGVYFVGATVVHNAFEYPAPQDTGAVGGGCSDANWVFGSGAGIPVDLSNPSLNGLPPQTISSAGLPGAWLLHVNCGPGAPGTPYCFGDGTGAACPCGNNGAAGNGCANSIVPAGANLTATGVATVGADSVTLVGTGMPNSSCLYFQGTTQISLLFGDGLRCAGGTVIRLGTKTNVGGASQYPTPGDLSVSVRGAVPAGATRTYQVWYRNAAAFCTASTFNLSNGLSITWQ